MISFCKIGCKITLFCAHNQIKCTKTAEMCTLRPFCAMIITLLLRNSPPVPWWHFHRGYRDP